MTVGGTGSGVKGGQHGRGARHGVRRRLGRDSGRRPDGGAKKRAGSSARKNTGALKNPSARPNTTKSPGKNGIKNPVNAVQNAVSAVQNAVNAVKNVVKSATGSRSTAKSTANRRVGEGVSRGPGRVGGRMDPRISARRTAVQKEQGRRRLRVLVIGLAGTGVLVGAWFLIHSPIFSARSVTVTGNVHETAAVVEAQAGLESHPALLDVNAGAAAAAIERLPWVRTAAVHVSWPDGVHIAVTEETPRFVVSEPGSRWESLSADGRVLGVSATRPAGLLLLTVPQAPGAPGTVLSVKDAPGLRVASTLPASFAAQVTAVTVEPAGWVQLALTTPIVVDIGSAAELTAKYEDVSSILAGATLHNGDVIDVSVPDAPTVTGG